MGVVSRPRKRLYLALVLISLILAALSGYGLWKISFQGLSTISSFLPMIVGSLILVIILIVAAGVAGIILAILGFPTLGMFKRLAWSATNLLFPLAIQVGKVFDIEKERVERSFIEVSNHLVRQKNIKVMPERLLVLSPHCIQHESCPHKITRDVTNCRQCGKCRVGDLLSLVKRYNVKLAIVTGGTLARKVIKDIRPHAVLAIACERDLTSGIQDVFPLPVIGVLNERPEGPCCNTTVDLDRVEKVIKDFLAVAGQHDDER
jgi:hypothetical protein